MVWNAILWNCMKNSGRYSASKFDKKWHFSCFYHEISSKNDKKSMLGVKIELWRGWGGLVRLFGLPWGFTPNLWGSRQKIISDRAHPLPCQNEKSKMPILAVFREKKSNFWNCCRNFWQKFLSKILATWWGPSTPILSGDAILWIYMHYSQS